MQICVIGTGYVGLVTGAVLADLGNRVICIDKDHTKIAALRRGVIPIFEPGLEEMVSHNVNDHRLEFSGDIARGIEQAEIVFICVGTPSLETGESDVSQVQECALAIADSLNEYKVIVNKSTVPVGTGEMVRDIITSNRRENVGFDVVSNPEFLREGSAIHDTLYPDRIVIGAPNNYVAMKLLELYAPLERPMLLTDVASAEIIKYASNAFLATKISFINSVASLCEVVGADIQHVVKGMGYDARIGPAFLQPGLGYGGSCFPKDSAALLRTAEKLGCKMDIVRAAIEVNDRQVPQFMDRLEAAIGGFQGRTVGILGLAFKPNTDDMREARSILVIDRLLEAGATVKAYDPASSLKAQEIWQDVIYAENAYEAAEDADALVIVTEWNEFKLLDLERVRASMRGNLIFDGRNVYDSARMTRLGFNYHGIGRSMSGAAPPLPVGAGTGNP